MLPPETVSAAHPEVQRMAANIRTDLDRFSLLEISALVRHGYCVGRCACRSRPDLFGAAIPAGAPWDPLVAESEKAAPAVPVAPRANVPVAAPETEQTRTLQRSATRRLWSTLLDYRAWTSFIYVPLLVPILVILPYYAAKWYHQSQVAQRLIEGIPVEEVRELAPPDNNGIEVIADMRVIDLRHLQLGATRATDDRPLAFVYCRMRIQKKDPTANRFTVQFRLPTAQVEARTLNSRVPPGAGFYV